MSVCGVCLVCVVRVWYFCVWCLFCVCVVCVCDMSVWCVRVCARAANQTPTFVHATDEGHRTPQSEKGSDCLLPDGILCEKKKGRVRACAATVASSRACMRAGKQEKKAITQKTKKQSATEYGAKKEEKDEKSRHQDYCSAP